MAVKSRGPPRPIATRDSARWMSGQRRKKSRTASQISGFSKNQPVAASRSRIVSISREGDEILRSRSRPPAAVVVRSIAANNEPSLPPESERVNSRLRRVAPSI